MDFGKLPATQIPLVDFTLPPDGRQTMLTLAASRPAAQPAFHVGCARWGRKDWVGALYPERTKEGEMLDEYAKRFNTMELNAVFYSIPPAGLMAQWRDKVKQNAAYPGFLFLPKVSRTITHIKRLADAREQMDQFMDSIVNLKPYLGPKLLQLGDNFGPKNYHVLENFVEKLPAGHQFFVELRHEDWFADPANRAVVFNLLASNKVGAVITDASGRRDCVHMELSIPEVYIRFVGNGVENRESDFKRVDEWVIRIKDWLDKGLEKVYFICHQHDEGDTYILAKYVIEQFNKCLGAGLPEIKLPKQEGSDLFDMR